MGKWQGIYQRCSYGKEIYLWGWRWVVFVIWALPLAIIGIYDTAIGQEFISSDLPRIGKLLNNWDSNWLYYWIIIGAILFIVVTFEGAFRILRRKMTSHQPNSLMILNKVPPRLPYLFYLNRKDLATARDTLSVELKGIQKIWATWITGGSILENDEMLSKNIKPKEFKLILADPTDDYILDNIEPLGKGNKERWKIQIRSIAGQVHKIGGSVYFYKGILGDPLLIADPNYKENVFSDDAWARVDTIIPYRANSKRSSYKIIKREAPEQFDSLVEHFNTLMGRKDRLTEYKGEYDDLSST